MAGAAAGSEAAKARRQRLSVEQDESVRSRAVTRGGS